MKYQFTKTVNGNVVLNEDTMLTEKNPVRVFSDEEAKSFKSFKTYLVNNPFVKVTVLDEVEDCAIENVKKQKKITKK